MNFHLLNFILLISIGGFIIYGLSFGFLQMFGGLLGTVLGAYVAAHSFEGVAIWLQQVFGGSLNVERVIAFFLIFILVNRLVGIAFVLVDKVFSFLSFVPFLKLVDRLLGAVLGFAEAVLVLGLTLWLASYFPIPGLHEAVQQSDLANQLMGAAFILLPLIPAGIRAASNAVTAS